MDAVNVEEILTRITEKAKKQNELIQKIREIREDIKLLKITDAQNPYISDINFNNIRIYQRELPVEKLDLISTLVREGLEEQLKDMITELINL